MNGAGTEQMGSVATFFLRLGFYLLVAPLIGAAAAIGLEAIVLGSVDSPGPTYFAFWLIALPVALLYMLLLSFALAVTYRITFGGVVVCSVVLALVLSVPAYQLSRVSGSGSPTGIEAWQVALSVFLPILLTGLVCWLIARPLHRRSL